MRTTKRNRKQIINSSAILIALFILIIGIPIARADNGAIIVTSDPEPVLVTIETNQNTIDITISAKDIEDIYAFSISMDYDPDNIKVDLIAKGDLFEDYGSAVVKNDIDNTAGHSEYMQTILSAEKGTSEEGTLTVIRITFADGEYSTLDGLNLSIQIANSVPEYVDVYVSPCNIRINAEAGDNGSQATQQPLQTAEVGIATPGPESEQEFESAEDQSVEEILQEIEDTDEEQSITETEVQSTATTAPANTDSYEQPTEVLTETNKNNTVYIIIGAVAAVAVIGAAAWFLIWRRRKAKDKEDS